MNTFKKFISLLLILVLMLSAFSACGKKDAPVVTESAPAETAPSEVPAAAPAEATAPAQTEETSGFYQVGDKIDDFTITTYDGREISLYKVLEEKDMVMLNLWATWCSACRHEFPYIQEAYEQYQDKMEIFAISVEATDTDEKLAAVAEEIGLTFCVARNTVDMESCFDTSAVPVSVVVDRFGTICIIEAGGIPDSSVFANVFATYTAEDYTESLFMPSLLSVKPYVEPADPAELSKALNAEGGNLVFSNSDEAFTWPMAIQQKDGRTVAAVTNTDALESLCTVETQVDVKAGDVLVMEYLFQNQIPLNYLKLEVDGETVKQSAKSCDWSTYAYHFDQAGSHTIRISFQNTMYGTVEGDGLWIDSIRLVSGDEAAKALANNPRYPVSQQITAEILNENRKQVIIDFGYSQDVAYRCQDPTLTIKVTLDETVDPEFTYCRYGSGYVALMAEHATEDGYLVEIPNTQDDSVNIFSVESGNAYLAYVNYFLDEAQLEALSQMSLALMNQVITWEYSDAAPVISEPVGDVVYTITYEDQNGNPVPGVMCQVCDDTLCQVFVSDANGVCTFTLPGYPYEIHTLKVPEGYVGDTTTVTLAPVQGGELSFILTQN